MFTETVTGADGTSETAICTEQHAATLLRTALRRGYRMEATRTGGVVITRDVHTGAAVPRQRVVTVEPAAPLGAVTTPMREALDAIGRDSSAFRVDSAERPFQGRVGRITASGLTSVPPAAAERLVARGLVTVGAPYLATSNGYLPETRVPVRLSIAARLARIAADHRTRTTAPAGYVYPADIGFRFIGKDTPCGALTYDRISHAGCTCHTWTGTFGDRDDARRQARRHREAATAVAVAELLDHLT